MENNWDHLGLDQLRKGRISLTGARYFVTLNTCSRKEGLCLNKVAESLISILRQQQANQDFELLCGTIMPNHIHILFVLGKSLSLSRVVGKFKSLAKDDLKRVELEWQSNFYDHRLRFEVSAEAFSRYIYLNPYRKELILPHEVWPWWIVSNRYRPEFMPALRKGCPPDGWVRKQHGLAYLIAEDRFNSVG
jgi:REP element-mobilizing transposase RayT